MSNRKGQNYFNAHLLGHSFIFSKCCFQRKYFEKLFGSLSEKKMVWTNPNRPHIVRPFNVQDIELLWKSFGRFDLT